MILSTGDCILSRTSFGSLDPEPHRLVGIVYIRFVLFRAPYPCRLLQIFLSEASLIDEVYLFRRPILLQKGPIESPEFSTLAQLRNLLLSLGPALRVELFLGLSVVLGGVDAVLVVVDEVEPRDGIEEGGRVPRLPCRDALHVWAQRAHAVEGLAALDLVDHLPHVQLDLSCVLSHAVESYCEVRLSASVRFVTPRARPADVATPPLACVLSGWVSTYGLIVGRKTGSRRRFR